MANHLTNPPLNEKTRRPKENGQTRPGSSGTLLWLDPLDGTWKPAVLHNNIRGKLIRKASRGGPYTYPRVGGNVDGSSPTNTTAFLLKDKDVGPDRSRRPDILFQIKPNHDQHSEEPTEYMTDDGLVVLDRWMHGIRSFPDVLPLTLDSELDGQSIEYYMRQNRAITLYDIIVRMPYNYTLRGIKYTDPPKQNALSVRAQRFRASTLCLSWRNSGLTVKKNAAILALIPEACKRTDVNSTKAIANDLSKAEADKIGADSKKGGAKAKLKSEGNTKGKQDSIVKGKGKGKAKVADKEETEDEEDFQCGEDDDENANANADNEMLSNDSVDDEHYDEAPPSASPQDFHLPPAATSKPNSKRKWTADEADKPSNDVLDSSSRRPKRARTGVPLPEQPICQPTNARKSVGQARVGAESNYQAGKSVSALLPSANACPAKVFDESDDDSSQMETDSEPEDGDYRYIDPIGRASDGNDQATIQRALELTRIEFFDKTGNVVPQSLAVDFCYESYASQHRRIQEDYRKYRKGFLDAPKLFRLAAWKGGFSKWKVTYATSRNGANPTGWNLKVRMLNEEDRQAREDAQLAKKIEREERAGKS